jgi:hypothetical protein
MKRPIKLTPALRGDGQKTGETLKSIFQSLEKKKP